MLAQLWDWNVAYRENILKKAAWQGNKIESIRSVCWSPWKFANGKYFNHGHKVAACVKLHNLNWAKKS